MQVKNLRNFPKKKYDNPKQMGNNNRGFNQARKIIGELEVLDRDRLVEIMDKEIWTTFASSKSLGKRIRTISIGSAADAILKELEG